MLLIVPYAEMERACLANEKRWEKSREREVESKEGRREGKQKS